MSQAIITQLEQLAADLAGTISLCDRGLLRREEATAAIKKTTDSLRGLLPGDSIPHRILESRHGERTTWTAVRRNSNGFSGSEDCGNLRRHLETITLIGREYVPDFLARSVGQAHAAPARTPIAEGPTGASVSQLPLVSMITGLAPAAAPAQSTNIAPHIKAGDASNVIVGQTNYVRIDTAGPNWKAFEERVADVLEQIRRSNELAPDEKRQISSEIKAGVELMRSPAVERPWVDRFVTRPLKHLAEKFASSAVGAAASEAVKWLLKILGS